MLNDEIFLNEDQWHKLLNIATLAHFCQLMIYLARIPKHLRGYLLGVGLCLIILI